MNPITVIDDAISQQRQFWRRSRSRLGQGQRSDESFNGISEGQREVLQEQAAAGDPVAQALEPWVTAMDIQRRRWPSQVERSQRWSAAGPGGQPSMRSTRAAWLAAKKTDDRELAASDFPRRAREMSLAELELIKRRSEEGQTDPLPWVEGRETEAIVELATRLLDATDDMAREIPTAPWNESLRFALCVDASEGWPAHLNSAWIESVFAGTRIVEGLRINAISVPPSWGANSFARALGRFGIAWLEACRPKHVPLALHEHPRGTRRHVTHSLFASLIADQAFAKRVLGLGSSRARNHERQVAWSHLRHIRLEALRTLLWATIEQGPHEFELLQERFCALTERTLGTPLPATLLAVTPVIDHAAGARIIGCFEAAQARHELIQRFDQDWFRNPQAIEQCREANGRARAPGSAADEGFERLLDALGQSLG